MTRLPAILAAAFLAGAAPAQETGEPPMTLTRLGDILTAVDPDARLSGTQAQLTVRDVPVVVIVDPPADRMRVVVPIRSAEAMTAEELMRVMQANFDTALDARYAIAGGRLWATYIHPLSPLERDQFLSALGQTVNLALSYGTLYSGGALSFGGGDSGELHRQLIEDLLKRGRDI